MPSWTLELADPSENPWGLKPMGLGFFLTHAHRVGSVLWLVGMAGAAWSSLFT